MQRQKIAVKDVLVEARQRELDHEHVKSLAESIKLYGLVQPIVINQENRLIAGGHRLAAHKLLNLEEIEIVYKETLSEDQLQELELTENIKRKDLKWTEICLAVAKIHFLKVKQNALDSKAWGHRETGQLLNKNQAQVTYSLKLAKELLSDPAKSNEFWRAENFSEAWSIIMRKEQEAAEALLATTQNEAIVDGFEGIFPDIQEEEIDLTQPRPNVYGITPSIVEEAKTKYLSNPYNDPNGFDDYWKEKETLINRKRNEVSLSSRYFKIDCIDFMNNNPERFDHIICDIPYGINIDMCDQHIGIKDIDTIRDEHTVEGNLDLFQQFFPAAFTTLKESAFCLVWCDYWHFRHMADLAMDAGFKVQRWPVVWDKTYQCLNQMSQYNFTKSTEAVLVCRKGNITLPEKQTDSVIHCGKDALTEKINHPFAKPFECWKRLVEAVSIKNQSLLDPFAGRGSSLLSFMELERIAFGCEINEQHYNAGLENLKQWYLSKNQNSIFV
jgi:ParB/RepB/Spo0J family partition protein